MWFGLSSEDLMIISIVVASFLIAFYVLKTIKDKQYIQYLKGELKATEQDTFNSKVLLQSSEAFKKGSKSRLDWILSFIGSASQERWQDRYTTRFEKAGYSTLHASSIYILMTLICISFFCGLFVLLNLYVPFVAKQGLLTRSCALMLFIFLGFRSFNYYLDFRTLQRYKLIKRDLTSALDLLAICTSAGISLERGFDQVSEEIGLFNPELGKELAITAAELSILPDRRQALLNLRKRVNMPLVTGMVTTFIQSEEQGTSISDTLRVLSISFVKEKLLEIETKAARLPAILSIPLVLLILPSLFVVILGPGVIQLINQFNL